MKLAADADFALAWVLGAARDSSATKQRMRLGYEGVLTDDVSHDAELWREH